MSAEHAEFVGVSLLRCNDAVLLTANITQLRCVAAELLVCTIGELMKRDEMCFVVHKVLDFAPLSLGECILADVDVNAATVVVAADVLVAEREGLRLLCPGFGEEQRADRRANFDTVGAVAAVSASAAAIAAEEEFGTDLGFDAVDFLAVEFPVVHIGIVDLVFPTHRDESWNEAVVLRIPGVAGVGDFTSKHVYSLLSRVKGNQLCVDEQFSFSVGSQDHRLMSRAFRNRITSITTKDYHPRI